MFHDTVTRVRAPMLADRWGNDTPDWPSATRTAITEVVVLPTSQVEDAAGNRISLSTGWRLYSRPGTDIDLLASDRIEWGGMSLEVIGDVARWPHPIRGPQYVHHVEAELRKMEG